MFLHVACNTSFNWHDAHAECLQLTWCSPSKASLWILVMLCWELNFVEFQFIQILFVHHSLCVRIRTTSRDTPCCTWFDDAACHSIINLGSEGISRSQTWLPLECSKVWSVSCAYVSIAIELVLLHFEMVVGSRKGFLAILVSLDSCIYTQRIFPSWVMFSLLLAATLLLVMIHHSCFSLFSNPFCFPLVGFALDNNSLLVVVLRCSFSGKFYYWLML